MRDKATLNTPCGGLINVYKLSAHENLTHPPRAIRLRLCREEYSPANVFRIITATPPTSNRTSCYCQYRRPLSLLMSFKSAGELPVQPLCWRFSQCFGEKGNADDLTEGK